MTIQPTRRAALATAAATLAVAILPATTARAAAPLANRQAPGFQRFRVGRYEVTALLDGTFTLDLAAFPNAGADAPALLSRAFVPNAPLSGVVTAFAVNTGDRLYLVDCGTNAGFAPTLAKLPEALSAAGLDPATVDALLMTHLHADHVGGAARDGRAVFPNAEMVVPEAEAAFWLDPATLANASEMMRPFVQVAQASVAPYASRLRRIAPGARVAPGIEAVALPGHTAGHTGYLLSEGGQSLLLWGDVVHAAALQLPRPAITFAFDVDGAAAAATRARALDRAASERLMIGGVHMPFPGVGHIARDGAGYTFVPAPFLPL